MVDSSALDRTFAALADPTRRAIIARLSQGEATVSDLAAPFGMSLQAVLKHLGALESAGLLRRKRRGRHHYCRLDARPLTPASDWITLHTELWRGQLAQLEAYLRDTRE